MSRLAATIRKRRVEIGMPREQLAYLAGLSLATIIRIEMRGHIPRADRLAAIARVLGVSMDDLLGLNGEVA